MPSIHYEETICKSVLNRVKGMGLDMQWSLNPYKGCVHGCHYCFARRYHGWLDLSAEEFVSVIFVKRNAVEVLRAELAKRSWKREPVALGTATDPYQPIEGKYRLTRGILQALHDFRTPVNLVTKGTMVVRDADILSALQQRAGATVCHSITTLDPDTWRKLEPGTPPPWQRLRALRTLAEAGVNAGVLLAPVVPGLTDSFESLEAVVKAAAEHGARFLSGGPMRLQPGVKEHFLGWLQKAYPHLSESYGRLYPDSYVPRAYADLVGAQVRLLKARYDLNGRELPRPLREPEPRQLPLAV